MAEEKAKDDESTVETIIESETFDKVNTDEDIDETADISDTSYESDDEDDESFSKVEESENNDEEDSNDDEEDLYDVEIGEEDPSDVSNEEIIENKKDSFDEDIVTNNDIKLSEIDEKQKELFMEKIKSEKIDWSKVEFLDDEKIIPKLDDENINVFSEVSSDVFERGTIDVYIDLAKSQISEWIEAKKEFESKDESELTIDDKKYYESLTKAKDDARLILATVQEEGKKLSKEFEEDKIAETVIKSVTLGALKDFIVDKFKLSTTWVNKNTTIEEEDRSNVIKRNLLDKMYVSTMFNEYIKRDTYKSIGKSMNNRFGAHYFNNQMKNFVYAISSYISNLDEEKQKNLNIKTIVSRDFNVMEYFKVLITYAFKRSSHVIAEDGTETDKIVPGFEFINDIEFKEKDIELFNTIINPNGVFDGEFSRLTSDCLDFMKLLKDPIILNQLEFLALNNFTNDPLYKNIKIESIDDYNNNIVEISSLFPEEIESLHIGKWSKVYSFMQKYDRYMTFRRMTIVLKNEDIDDKGKHVAAFNTMNALLSDQFMFMYGNFITDLQEFVTSKVYSKDTRPIMFSSIMNTMILQHDLGFKTPFIPNENSSGDKLYELAKNRFGDQYEYIVGDKDEDILLKDVDLVNVHKDYINSLLTLIKDMIDDIHFINENSKDPETGKDLAVVMENILEKPVVSKKSKKHRHNK